MTESDIDKLRKRSDIFIAHVPLKIKAKKIKFYTINKRNKSDNYLYITKESNRENKISKEKRWYQ